MKDFAIRRRESDPKAWKESHLVNKGVFGEFNGKGIEAEEPA